MWGTWDHQPAVYKTKQSLLTTEKQANETAFFSFTNKNTVHNFGIMKLTYWLTLNIPGLH